MEEARPSFRCSGGERRMEIVSGKAFGSNQIYTASRPRSPDLTAVKAQVGRQNAAVAEKPWGFNDGEMRRRKRIAKYKVYTIEGRVKASIRSGIRWIKNKCSEFIHGY